jgi:ankyrin repeat protein
MMLDEGWPAHVDGQPVTPLHWAAYHGDADLVRALLERGGRRDVRDAEHQGTPFNWAQHGVEHAPRRGGEDYAAVLELLT